MPDSKLPSVLHKIRRVFDTEALLQRDVSKQYTVDYYTKTNFFYRHFHSKKGAMHFPLYWHEGIKGHDDGLQQQALFVQAQATMLQASHILELGSGQGYNSCLLANWLPNIQFTGIDLTPLHVQQASEKTATLSNLHFVQGNFEALSFENNSFDIAFGVETLCHAHDSLKVFTETYRILKPNGRMIVFDGFHTKKRAAMTEAECQAVDLLALAFAVQEFKEIERWMEKACQAGFKVLAKKNIALAILPNLKTLEQGANRLFTYPTLTKIATKIGLLPQFSAIHAIAGMLAPTLIEEGVIGYFQVVLEKGRIGQ